jgi:hypothetical protein
MRRERREGEGVGRREGRPAGTQHGALSLDDMRDEKREERRGEKEKKWVEGKDALLVPSMAPSH